MGIAVNLVTYLVSTMHLPSATSANTVTDFMGTSFLLCLLGGFLADSFLGRFRTIAIFATVQAMVSVNSPTNSIYKNDPSFPMPPAPPRLDGKIKLVIRNELPFVLLLFIVFNLHFGDNYDLGYWHVSNNHQTAAASTTSMQKYSYPNMQTSQWLPNGNSILGLVSDCTGDGWPKIECLRIWNRSIR